MKFETKRIVSIFLSLIILMLVIPTTISAEDVVDNTTTQEFAIAQGNQTDVFGDGKTYSQPFDAEMWQFYTNNGPYSHPRIVNGNIQLLESGFNRYMSSVASVYLKNTIHLQSDLKFSMKFTFSMPNPGNEDEHHEEYGGDGIAFVINAAQNVGSDLAGGMGYKNIEKSIIVELDAWNNDEGSSNHIAIMKNGDNNSHLVMKSFDNNGDRTYNFNDGSKYTVWVDYCDEKLTASVMKGNNLDNTEKPNTPDISYDLSTQDLMTLFDTQDVFVGFSAGEYYAYADHIIHGVYFKNEYTNSIPIDVTQATVSPKDLPSFTVTKNKNDTVEAFPSDYFGELDSGDKYVFYKAGETVPISSGMSFEIPSVMNNDGERYEYAVLNSAGLQTEKRGTITVMVLESNQCALLYNANGGSGNTEAKSGDLNSTVAVSDCNFNAPNGYFFAGWNTEQDGSGEKYDANSDFQLINSENMLYAQWKKLNISLAFGSNGGLGSHEEITGNESAIVLVPNNSFEAPLNSQFVSWNTEIDGSGITYYPGDEYILLGSNNMLYAQWEKKASTLVYDANQGTGFMDSIISRMDSTIIVNECDFTSPTNYEFIGWNTRPDGTGTTILPGEEYLLVNSENILYAQWKAVETTNFTVDNDNKNSSNYTAPQTGDFDESRIVAVSLTIISIVVFLILYVNKYVAEQKQNWNTSLF